LVFGKIWFVASEPREGGVGTVQTTKEINTWRQLLPRFNAAKGGPSVAGSLGFVVSTILCTYGSNVLLSFYSRLCIGVVASMTEAVGGRYLPFIGTMADDNLLIPIVVGFLISWLDNADE